MGAAVALGACAHQSIPPEPSPDELCARGSLDRCVEIAWSLFDADPPGPARSAALLELACARDSGQACHDLARAFEWGRGVPLDRQRALELYGRACALQDAHCAERDRLGELLRFIASRDTECRSPASATTPSEDVVEANDPPAVMKVVLGNKQQVLFCAHRLRTIGREPPRGRVEIVWIIAPDGTVADVSVKESTIRQPALAACLAERIRTWRFPCPKTGSPESVTFPFTFG